MDEKNHKEEDTLPQEFPLLQKEEDTLFPFTLVAFYLYSIS